MDLVPSLLAVIRACSYRVLADIGAGSYREIQKGETKGGGNIDKNILFCTFLWSP